MRRTDGPYPGLDSDGGSAMGFGAPLDVPNDVVGVAEVTGGVEAKLPTGRAQSDAGSVDLYEPAGGQHLVRQWRI